MDAITKPRNSRRFHRRGLSLVEVVVASALLVAAVIPILRAMTVAHGTLRKVEQHSRCLGLAEHVLASARATARVRYQADLAQYAGALGDGYYAEVTDDRHSTLRTLVVRVGFDQDGNGRLGSDEYHVVLNTQVARLD